MPKIVHLTDAELDARDAARDYLRSLYGDDDNRNDNVAVVETYNDKGKQKRRDITTRFWGAISTVWPAIILKGRQTVSIADKVYAYVCEHGPVNDMEVYKNCEKVGISDARRYLAREVESPCHAMEKVDGNDAEYVIACDPAELTKYQADGFKIIEIRIRRTAAQIAADKLAANVVAEAADRVAAEAAEAAEAADKVAAEADATAEAADVTTTEAQ